MEADVEIKSLCALFDLKPPNHRYSGQLRERLVRAPKLELLLGGSPKEQTRIGEEENARILAEQVDKLFLLLDHFKIPRKSDLRWFHLALCLARQHVPGMEIVEGPPLKRGPKGRQKGPSSDHQLVAAVAAVEITRRKGTADAIRILRKRHPDLWGRFTQKNLQNRYSKFQKEILLHPAGNLIDNLASLFGLTARSRKP